MATITVNQYADDGTTARSAGEVLTVNGGTITFRRDSRDAAGNNYTLGGNSVISATLGGGIVFDGRNVRWLAITGGSGSAAIGTTVSQGGVSGYFLGYWSSLTARGSTTIGATGWIKLREVTGGSFSAGALSGITATAAGADVTGWLEIVADQSANFNVPRLGNFTVRGDWFYLDDTTGSAGQILQVPTNGGGATTECPGVWIETSPGSNEYDFFPALKTTTQFTTTNLGTDARSKFVQNMNTGGQMRIGSDGTNNIGYVPPAGCKTRVPNMFFRQCTTAARGTNAVPHTTIATRPDFTTTSAGYMDIEYFYGDWYLLFAQPYYVKLNHVATFDSVNISECATALDLRDGFTGMSAALDINSLLLTSNFAGGVIEDWGGPRGNAAGTNDHDISINYCIGQTFSRVRGGILAYARSSGVPIYVNQSSDITFNNCRCSNGPITINTSFNINVNNHDHVDRYTGATTTAAGYAVTVTNSCVGVKIDGLTWGMGGAIANCHPYSGVLSAAASSNIKLRNLGTRSAFLNGGSANNPGYIFVDGGNNVDVALQRCYVQPTRTGAHQSVNSSKNMLFEDVYGDWADSIVPAGLNLFVRGGGGTNTTTGQASVYGTHFGGAFQSDTVGRVWLACNEPTAETAWQVATNFGTGSGFTSAGGVTLVNVGDYLIVEMPILKKQHTGFQNTAPTLTGTNTGNHSFEYQIDTGGGWNGTWKTISGANLSAESISPADGFKLKFKIECTTANASNLVSFVRIDTTSTLAAQVDNLYPLDVNTLTLTGLKAGSEVRCYTGTPGASAVEIAGVESSGTSFAFTHSSGGVAGFITVIHTDYQAFSFGIDSAFSYTASDISLPVSQVLDRNYTP